MNIKRTRLWYLLEWHDRDKCLLAAVPFGLLQLYYWLLINLVARHTDFGLHYVSERGLVDSQWLLAAGELVWLGLIAWGALLRRCQRESRLYTTLFLYLFSLPLMALGYLAGLYNPVFGVMLLGAGLSGTILFDFRTIIGPFVFSILLMIALIWATGHHYLDYAPLLRFTPIGQARVSGVWVLLMVLVAAPFVTGVFMITWLLLARWHEREDKLRSLSTVDPLTGLLNRRALFARIQPALSRAARNNESMALAIMDIDHFKQVNDTHGHAAGDAVLRALGQCLPNCLRGHDLVGRVGGEEFVILLTCNMDDATRIIERCRRAVESMRVTTEDGLVLNVTASFGLYCAAVPDLETTLYTMMKHADRALYRVKSSGRNQVAVA